MYNVNRTHKAKKELNVKELNTKAEDEEEKKKEKNRKRKDICLFIKIFKTFTFSANRCYHLCSFALFKVHHLLNHRGKLISFVLKNVVLFFT